MSRLFGTDGVRGLANETLTVELSVQLAQAASPVLGAEAFDAAAEAAKTLQFQLARVASGRTPRIETAAQAFVDGHLTGMLAVREALGLEE